MNQKLIGTMVVIGLVLSIDALAAERLPFESSFETGDFSEWDGGRTDSMRTTQQQVSDGVWASESTMTSGQPTDNYLDYYFGDHRSVGGEPADNGLWLEYDFLLSPDFDFGFGKDFHKTSIINFTDEAGLRRYQIIIDIHVPTMTWVIENLAWNADRSFDKSVSYFENNVGSARTITPGTWNKVTLYLQPNTPGAADGIVRLWIDDLPYMDYEGANVRESASYNPNKFILSNYAPATDIVGSQYWDDVYLGEEMPGSDNGTRPEPPILDQ